MEMRRRDAPLPQEEAARLNCTNARNAGKTFSEGAERRRAIAGSVQTKHRSEANFAPMRLPYQKLIQSGEMSRRGKFKRAADLRRKKGNSREGEASATVGSAISTAVVYSSAKS